MTAAHSYKAADLWRRRLRLPTYGIAEAARYAKISPKTVADWHRAGGRVAETLSEKRAGESLSYFQLIEVAVVAAFREAGMSLKRIREARQYVAHELKAEFPFAEYRFKSDGKVLLMDYEQVEGKRGRGKLLGVNERGQLSWDEIIGRRLHEFDYEDHGIVVRWHLRGTESAVLIDPRIAFGAPVVSGTPTWVLRGRWDAGESLEDIADDFGIDLGVVREALEFEGARIDVSRQSAWLH